MPGGVSRRLVDVGDDQVGRIARIDREVDGPGQPFIRPGGAKRLPGEDRGARLHLDPYDLRTDRSRDEQYCHERSQDHRHLKAAVYSRRLEEKTMLPTHLRRSLYSVGLLLTLSLTAANRPIHAQAPPPDVARDPDVLAAQRLFTVWLEGQMVSRALAGNRHRRRRRPGTDLVEGIRLCRHRQQGGDDAADQVPHGIAQQAVHRHRHHAAARAGIVAPRRSGLEAPAVVRGHAGRTRRSADYHRRAAHA